MAFLDVTIVNVAFPSIAADFPGTTLADLSWVLNAYNIVVAALLVPAGRLADRVGQRQLFFGGLWMFLAGSVLCGLAPDARAADRRARRAGDRRGGSDPDVAGARAARVPARAASRRDERLGRGGRGRRGDGARRWAGCSSDAGGWRWAFLVNLVVALGVLPARRLLVDRTDPAGADPPDLFGGALLAGAVGLLAFGIVKAPDWGWTDDRVLARAGSSSVLALVDARGAVPAPPGAGAGAGPAPDPLVRGRERGDARAVDGLLRAAAVQRALPHAGLGLLRARRRLRRHRRPTRRGGGRGGRRAHLRAVRSARSCSCRRRWSPRLRACSTARSPATNRPT